MPPQACLSDRELRRNQIRVLETAEGFFHSSVLFALLKLDIFGRLEGGTDRLDALADELGARPETLARLLNAAVALGMLESGDGCTYRASPTFRSVLSPSADDHYLGNWILNLDYFREALAELDQAVLRSAPTVDPSGHLGTDAEHTREFTLAMHNYASLRGKELARFLDTTGARSLLDLGCGPGTYAFSLGERNPELALHLLDLPGVLEVARRDVRSRYELRNEVRYHPQDALTEEIEGTYDIVLVSNTLHMLGEEGSRELLKRLHRTVAPGGSLVIQAQYLDDDRMGGRWPVLLDLVQLCITPAGRNHSVGETRTWMEEAGFERIEFTPMTLLNTNSFLQGWKA